MVQTWRASNTPHDSGTPHGSIIVDTGILKKNAGTVHYPVAWWRCSEGCILSKLVVSCHLHSFQDDSRRAARELTDYCWTRFFRKHLLRKVSWPLAATDSSRPEGVAGDVLMILAHFGESH